MKARTPPRKAQSYLLELGLDAQIGPASDGTYQLARSFARWDRSMRTWVPAWSTEFQPGDWIAFRIFDYTAGEGLTLIAPRIFEVHFLDPHQSSFLKSPFSTSDPTENNPIIVAPQGLQRVDERSVATSSRVGWICSDSGGRKRPPYLPGERAHQLGKDQLGRFLFRVLIEVTVSANRTVELRTYDHDPEIFVGEGDPPPHRG